ncbi:MAG: ribosome small subunit-dependent GTPase A [Lachnospiraceae bacterium]|nr:ribosome small subunit-dependent GTPase A [Lachnospiraceae bacterium]
MEGKIVKSLSGFYYVDSGDSVYACRAKGIFRLKDISPLVGDNVVFDVTDEQDKEGNITSVKERKNSMFRPQAANVDQALVVFAAAKPDPNLNLLDRFLIMMQKQNIHTIICFNKIDIAADEGLKLLKETYELCGHEVVFASVRENEGINRIRELLDGKTTVLAGPSGVGKSSMMNLLAPLAGMETGELSKRIERGKQTTRHTELVKLWEHTYLTDTPGFTSLYIKDIAKEELRCYFYEFNDYSTECRFDSCMHINEPDCGVKNAVSAQLISRVRYENYRSMYAELEKQEAGLYKRRR